MFGLETDRDTYCEPQEEHWVPLGYHMAHGLEEDVERQRRADTLSLCSTSGESGSGKTEATKLILRCLAAMNQRRDVMQQVRPTTQPPSHHVGAFSA